MRWAEKSLSPCQSGQAMPAERPARAGRRRNRLLFEVGRRVGFPPHPVGPTTVAHRRCRSRGLGDNVCPCQSRACRRHVRARRHSRRKRIETCQVAGELCRSVDAINARRMHGRAETMLSHVSQIPAHHHVAYARPEIARHRPMKGFWNGNEIPAFSVSAVFGAVIQCRSRTRDGR